MLFQEASFQKESFSVGEDYGDTHFSFSFSLFNYKCLKLKQNDMTGDKFLPLEELIQKKAIKIIMNVHAHLME